MLLANKIKNQNNVKNIKDKIQEWVLAKTNLSKYLVTISAKLTEIAILLS